MEYIVSIYQLLYNDEHLRKADLCDNLYIAMCLLSTIYNGETCLQDIIDILKRTLQNI